MENNLSYFEFVGKANLKSHSEILKRIKGEFSEAAQLDTKFAIFFDTNVLLRTYSISFKARERLHEFYENRKVDIFLTNQVQKEFIKNREDVINKFFDNVTNKIPNDFKSEVIAQIGAYLDRNKTIFKDYEEFEKDLEKVKSECEKLYKALVDQVENKRKKNIDLMFDDKQLSIFIEENCLPVITDQELKKCVQEFDLLKKGIEIDKISSIMNKPGKVFPGLGDIKEKPEEPYGDYIIFYELMKFASEKKRDIIFLTHDVTKGDWMRKDKKPHIHYVENFFLNTGQLLYIFDAERIFEEILDISFKSLIKPKTESQKIDLDSIQRLLNERYPNNEQGGDETYTLSHLFIELHENGYDTIEQIIHDLNRAEEAYQEAIRVKENSINRFTRIGNLRIRLELCNKDYKMLDPDTMQTEKTDRTYVAPFEHLVK